MKKQPHIVELKITAFSKDGQGQGIWHKPDGQSHLVDAPFTIPGDEVLVHLFKRKSGVYQSQVLEWQYYSKDRVTPRCIHFGECGGCRWQQISYEDQLKQKEAWIHRYFEPHLHPEVDWHPMIPCLPPWQYRNKMELTFSSDKSGERYLGLILYGTRGHVFQMKECHLAPSWIIEAVQTVSHWWSESGVEAYHPGRDRGSLRTLTLREGQRTGDRMIMLTVSGNPEFALKKEHLQNFVSALRNAVEPSSPEQKLSIFLRIQQIAKGRQTQFYEMLLYGPDHIREILHIESLEGICNSLQFRISPSAFFQPNTRQAERLYSRALQMTQISKNNIVYDLYCGTGTLGICLANHVKEVIGIELSPESALDARENVKHNNLSNVSIHTGDVGRLLPTLLKEKKLRPDIVLVDPPRSGLDVRAIQHLLDIKAPQLTYISCNPSTQATNLDVLIKGGYRLQAIQPVDQFPQTIHVENIVVLKI
jgi:23S rRNA (uracil1939-C5)-methyltransferase